MFKISSDSHKKNYQYLERNAILKIPSIGFRESSCLSVGFKVKPLKLRTKTLFPMQRQESTHILPWTSSKEV